MDKIKQFCLQIWKATRNARIIMKKELRSYFVSPIAYIVITLFLVLSGVLVFPGFFLNNQADLRGFFDWLPVLFAIFIPIITMRLFAEERHTGTLEMLITMPFTSWDIIFGKIAAATVFSAVMLVPTFIYPISILFVGSPNLGPIIGGYIGAVFLAAAFASIGVFTSSVTRNQIIAVIVALVISIFLAVLHKFSMILPAAVVDVVEFIGAGYHYSSIGRGVIDTRDVLYFASVVAVFAMATSRVIEERR